MSEQTPPTEHHPWDPVFLNTRREAQIVLGAWLICLFWTIGFSYIEGYHLPSGEIEMVWGIPYWVFGGVLVPWILATLFTLIFGAFMMKNDPLGEVDEEADAGQEEDFTGLHTGERHE